MPLHARTARTASAFTLPTPMTLIPTFTSDITSGVIISAAFFAALLATAITTIAPTSAFAQPATGQITGLVVDDTYGLSLPGANVLLVEPARGTAADASGEFRIAAVAAGTYTLRVSYIGYRTYEAQVAVAAGQTTDLDIRLEAGVVSGDQVVVLGDGLRGQAKALSQQRNNANITNVVSSDQVGRFPDANIGDALKRIPGIATQVDQGEARFGIIRGTAPQLNSVTVNGERVPSAEAEIRSVQLDLIPADMIQTIEVNKAVTPDMAADAIGASVNLVTRAAPNGLRVSATLGSGYNFLSEKPIVLGSFIIGNRFADDRLGVIISGSFQDHKLGSHNIEAEWEDGEIQVFETRLYDVQRTRRSLSGTLDYALSDNSTVTFKALYNHRDDWENRFRTVYERFADQGDGTAKARVRQQTKGGIGNDRVDYRRLEDQRAMTYSLSGTHLLGGRVKADWMAGYARASEERPNERYIRYQASNYVVNFDPSDTRKPAISFVGGQLDPTKFRFNELTEEYQDTRDIDRTAKIDFTLPLADYRSYLKFGAGVKAKEKFRELNFFEYEGKGSYETLLATMSATGALSDKTINDYLAGDYTSSYFVTPQFLGDLNLGNSADFDKTDLPEEYLPGVFDADETITSAYAMTNYAFSDRLSVIAGLRLEATSVDYTGNQLVLDASGDVDAAATGEYSGDQSYTDVLPGLHLRYAAGPNAVIRAAWTNTIARPGYYSLVPYRNINYEDNELFSGNPGLDPTRSMNLDLMADYYFESIGLLSGGVFFKSISDFIYTFENKDYKDPVSGNTFDSFFQPNNGEGATLVGAEIAIQRQLDFLPGFLRNLGVYVNYTLVSVDASEIRTADGEIRDDITLPGTAENTVNLSLSYETAKFSGRVSYNYTSSYLDEIGDEAQFDRYYDNQTFVDANASYSITPKLRFFVEANNLTNQPLRYYQGASRYLMQEEYYNVRFNAGLKIDF